MHENKTKYILPLEANHQVEIVGEKKEGTAYFLGQHYDEATNTLTDYVAYSEESAAGNVPHLVSQNKIPLKFEGTGPITGKIFDLDEPSLTICKEPLDQTLPTLKEPVAGYESFSDWIQRSELFFWGLIGRKGIESHSYAPHFWQPLFQALNLPINYFVASSDDYPAIEAKLGAFPYLLGYNAAMPWKRQAFENCDWIDERIKPFETVNTVVGKEGYNTDGAGMVKSFDGTGKNALIIGCGGASAILPLELLSKDCRRIYLYDVNENASNLLLEKYEKLHLDRPLKIISETEIREAIKECSIIINCSPCGSDGYKVESPFPLEFVKEATKGTVFAESIYNPVWTPLLCEAKSQGYEAISGVEMLVNQAALSFERLMGYLPPTETVENIKEKIYEEFGGPR